MISRPQRHWASGRLGVSRSARGNSSVLSASTASAASSLLPLVDTITGSSTILFTEYSLSLPAMARTMAAEDTIPIFTASGRMSDSTQSSCFFTNSGGVSCTPETPVVFCAVSDVITLMAYIPCTVMVLISA